MNAWIGSGGKVGKVAGGAKLSHKEASDLIAIQQQDGEVIATLKVGGDTFVVLSEEQPESGGAACPRISQGPLVA